jgi:hypothetical protein
VASEMYQQWLAWAQRERLGSPAQVESAVRAAIEAISRGETREEAARRARVAASAAGTGGTDKRGDEMQHGSGGDQLAPGSITWEIAMERAAYLMNLLPREASYKLSRETALAQFNLALAQGWITFARELTMHGRGMR